MAAELEKGAKEVPIQRMNEEWCQVITEGQDVVIRKAAAQSRIIGTVIALLIAGIFISGIIAAVRSGAEILLENTLFPCSRNCGRMKTDNTRIVSRRQRKKVERNTLSASDFESALGG